MSRSSERGSAAVEFILVGLPLLGLTLLSAQLLLSSYAKTVAMDAAVEAVQLVALADGNAQLGRERADQTLKIALPNLCHRVEISQQNSDGLSLSSVSIDVELPISWLGAQPVRVNAQAVNELQ